MGYSPWDHKESDTTEQLSMHKNIKEYEGKHVTNKQKLSFYSRTCSPSCPWSDGAVRLKGWDRAANVSHKTFSSLAKSRPFLSPHLEFPSLQETLVDEELSSISLVFYYYCLSIHHSVQQRDNRIHTL